MLEVVERGSYPLGPSYDLRRLAFTFSADFWRVSPPARAASVAAVL
jgi:hypothetical protein